MGKRLLALFWLMLVVTSLSFLAFQHIPALQEMSAKLTDKDFTDENIYTSIEGVAERLDEEILSGEDSFIVYLKDMDVSEINKINTNLNGVYGSGESYQELGTIGDSYTKVKIVVKRTINYYALQAVKTGAPIPDDQEKARHLYQVIDRVKRNFISDDMTDYEKELALHDYLVKHCVYSKNTDQDAESDIYRAYGALVNGDAVCNGYAEAMQLMLSCVGVESQFVAGKGDGVDHAWNLVKIDGKWYHLDTTWDDPSPDRGEIVNHTYFNLTDDEFEENHEWDRNDYPAATGTKYQYYTWEDRSYEDFEEYKKAAYDYLVLRHHKSFEGSLKDYTENEEQMGFIFENNSEYKSINWASYELGDRYILVIDVK